MDKYYLVRLLPLTWFIWIMWNIGLIRKGCSGVYYGDPGILFIIRWVFKYKPIVGRTDRSTRFVGNWHWFDLIFWEIHLLLKDKKPKIKRERVFP